MDLSDRVIQLLEERLAALKAANRELQLKHPPFPLQRSLTNLNKERAAAGKAKIELHDFIDADWMTSCLRHGGVIGNSCRVDKKKFNIRYLKGEDNPAAGGVATAVFGGFMLKAELGYTGSAPAHAPSSVVIKCTFVELYDPLLGMNVDMATGTGQGIGQPMDSMNISEASFFKDPKLYAPFGEHITPKVFFSEWQRVEPTSTNCKFPLPRNLWNPSETIRSMRQYTIMEDLDSGHWTTMGGALDCLEQVHRLEYDALWVDRTLEAVAQLHAAYMGTDLPDYKCCLRDVTTGESVSATGNTYKPGDWDCYSTEPFHYHGSTLLISEQFRNHNNEHFTTGSGHAERAIANFEKTGCPLEVKGIAAPTWIPALEGRVFDMDTDLKQKPEVQQKLRGKFVSFARLELQQTLRQLNATYQNWCATAESTKQQERLWKTRHTVVHGDLHLGNTMWNPVEKQVKLIDFQLWGRGPAAGDIAYMLLFCWCDRLYDQGRACAHIAAYSAALRGRGLEYTVPEIAEDVLWIIAQLVIAKLTNAPFRWSSLFTSPLGHGVEALAGGWGTKTFTDAIAAALGTDKDKVAYSQYNPELFKIDCAASMLHAFVSDDKLAADTPMGRWIRGG
jgi:hypothetical protein